MLKITNVFQRPNPEVQFHSVNMTLELFQHIKTVYKDTGMIVSIDVTKDLLNQTAVWVWNTPEDYEVYKNDPVIKEWFTTINDYNNSTGIIKVSSIKETI
jgi:hypothetical protein